MGLHALVAGDPAADREDAQLGSEPAAGEGAEPAAVAVLGQPALGSDPAVKEVAAAELLVRVAGGAQLGCLPPVVRPASGR